MKDKPTEEEFDQQWVQYSEMSKALGHPGRIAIIKLLMERNNQTCQEIVDQLPFSQSTVSQHLFKLKTAGFIEATNYKTATIFTLDYENLQAYQRLYQEVFGLKPKAVQFSLF